VGDGGTDYLVATAYCEGLRSGQQGCLVGWEAKGKEGGLVPSLDCDRLGKQSNDLVKRSAHDQKEMDEQEIVLKTLNSKL